MTTMYKWKDGYRASVKAQTAGERLEQLRERNGILTAKAVVDDARPEEAPLHKAFEWRDEVAAEKFREDQARNIIRAVTVVVRDQSTDEDMQTRAFVVVQKDDDTSGYESVAVAMSDDDMRAQIVKRALDELEGWRDRYEELQELARIYEAIETTEATLARPRKVRRGPARTARHGEAGVAAE